MKKIRHAIAAICKNNEIGYNGSMIFYISGDLKRFKLLTENNIVIMGRNTYESIGRPLPNRNNIVVTSHSLKTAENLWCVKTLEEAYALAEDLSGDEIFVIGGEQIYKAAINDVDILDITEIDYSPQVADTYFPNIDMSVWYISDCINVDDDSVKYRFVTYKKKKLIE